MNRNVEMDDINPNDRYLQPLEVINFFVNETGSDKRATNKQLVSHFRPLLLKESSNFGSENHAFLKKVTNQLAVVRKIEGNKYLELKPEFKDKDPHSIYTYLQLQDESIGEDNNPQTGTDNELSQKRCADEAEESNQKYQCLEQDAISTDDFKGSTKNNERSSKNVRFTEDTARSRAPLSLDLLSELNEWLGDDNKIEDVETHPVLDSGQITPKPPLPPHASDSPPPLPPKVIQSKSLVESNEVAKDERKMSTGFNIEQFNFDNFEDIEDMANEDKNLRNNEEEEGKINIPISNDEPIDEAETPPPPLPPKPSKNLLLVGKKDVTQGENKCSEILMTQKSITEKEESTNELPNIIVDNTETLNESNVLGSSEEQEADDSVFPLPDIGNQTETFKTKRTLTRDTNKTSSVKDLTRNFDQIVSDQTEANNKMSRDREVNRPRRWGPNSLIGDSLAKQPSRNSTTSEDFYSYRPLEDKGKKWILAGNLSFKYLNVVLGL